MPFFSSLPCPATPHPRVLCQGPTGLPMGQGTRQLSTYPFSPRLHANSARQKGAGAVGGNSDVSGQHQSHPSCQECRRRSGRGSEGRVTVSLPEAGPRGSREGTAPREDQSMPGREDPSEHHAQPGYARYRPLDPCTPAGHCPMSTLPSVCPAAGQRLPRLTLTPFSGPLPETQDDAGEGTTSTKDGVTLRSPVTGPPAVKRHLAHRRPDSGTRTTQHR